MMCCNCKNLGMREEDGYRYEWCEKVLDNPDIWMERTCRHYIPATQADVLRRQGDEALALFIIRWAGIIPIDGCSTLYEAVLKWLRSEVGNGSESE